MNEKPKVSATVPQEQEPASPVEKKERATRRNVNDMQTIIDAKDRVLADSKRRIEVLKKCLDMAMEKVNDQVIKAKIEVYLEML